MNNIIKKEANEAKEILDRIKKRDLEGNSGQAIKNSSYQFAITLVAKIGSLIFTVIIARLMLPETYGLYGLALSTILFIGVISDMGIGTALNTFMSKTLDKSPGKAKGYFKHLTKWKIILLVFGILLIIILSKWLATSYYQKQIYYALLAGIIYLPATILQGYLSTIFTSTNNFRPLLIKEIILQILRLTIIPLLIIYFIAKGTSAEIYLFWVFAALAVCYSTTIIYMVWRIKKDKPFRKSKAIELSKKEQKDLMKFILPLTITVFSGIVFGLIDQVMLGHYVESAFLGFYRASFNLVAATATIMAFSSGAIFPILARLKGRKLEKGFRKSRRITVIISILAAIPTFILAPLIIKVIYGPMYATSAVYLQILSILIISFPLIALYTTYYTSQKRTKIFSILLVSSTILNIVLNYIFINIGLQFSMSYAVIGACSATIISRFGYLGGLIIFRKWKT